VVSFSRPEAKPSATPEATTHGQDRNRDVSDLLKETLKQENTVDTFSYVQWLPTEYWRRTFENNPRYTPAQIEDAVQTWERYTVFVVIDAKNGGLALLMSYTPADEIRHDGKCNHPRWPKITQNNFQSHAR
jgi:hypothetical protein